MRTRAFIRHLDTSQQSPGQQLAAPSSAWLPGAMAGAFEHAEYLQAIEQGSPAAWIAELCEVGTSDAERECVRKPM